MKSRYRREDERQLFTLFKQLGLQIERERDLGRMIGYSIFGSLLDFRTNSNSQEEIIFGQVKQIHSGLEVVVDYAKQKEYYNKLCELKSKVDPWFRTESFPRESAQSRLMENIFSRLYTYYSKSYEDRLKRDGVAIYNEVMRDGPLEGKKNILIHDYNLIDWFFVKGGK
ncbi:MAG: hypothetical protein ABIA37_01430 [Candidatus Woesearchaeota archaeon]